MWIPDPHAFAWNPAVSDAGYPSIFVSLWYVHEDNKALLSAPSRVLVSLIISLCTLLQASYIHYVTLL